MILFSFFYLLISSKNSWFHLNLVILTDRALAKRTKSKFTSSLAEESTPNTKICYSFKLFHYNIKRTFFIKRLFILILLIKRFTILNSIYINCLLNYLILFLITILRKFCLILFRAWFTLHIIRSKNNVFWLFLRFIIILYNLYIVNKFFVFFVKFSQLIQSNCYYSLNWSLIRKNCRAISFLFLFFLLFLNQNLRLIWCW